MKMFSVVGFKLTVTAMERDCVMLNVLMKMSLQCASQCSTMQSVRRLVRWNKAES